MEQKDIIVLGVQVGLGILTLLGSGIVSAYVNSRLASYRTDKEFLRTKLETLLTAAFGYHWSAHQVAERLIKGLELTPDRVPEIRSQLLDDFLEISAHYKTVAALITLYFPELEPSWVSVGQQFAKIDIDYALLLFEIRANPPGYEKSLQKKQEKFNEEFNRFSDRLVEVSRTLRPEMKGRKRLKRGPDQGPRIDPK